MCELYTLPNGETTLNDTHYRETWEALADPFAKALHVSVHEYDNDGHVGYVYKESGKAVGKLFYIPVGVLYRFNTMQKARLKEMLGAFYGLSEKVRSEVPE